MAGSSRWLLVCVAACGRIDFDTIATLGEPPRLVIGDDHACLRTGHELACWGQNDNGQLATGDGLDRDEKTTILGFAAIDHALGQNHTCALDSDHAAWCWGTNAMGVLGCGAACANTTLSVTPVPVGDGRRYQRIYANDFHTCAIALDGGLYCWGSNDGGELGTGDKLPRSEPTLVLGGYRWRSAAMGNSHTCGIQIDGSLWCWGTGAGGVGQVLGADVLQPARVMLDGVTAYDGGGDYTCAIATGGALWCWGRDDYFETTFADGADRGPPAMTALHATAVAAGNTHACALDGTTVTCWGTDVRGELGTGDTGAMRASSPPVSGEWSAIFAGDQFTCAFDLADNVWCWGRNQSGQLGIGSMVDSAVPVMAH